MARMALGLSGSFSAMANCSVIFHCIWRAMASLAVTMGASARWLAFIASLTTQDLLQHSRLVYRSQARKDEPAGGKSKQFHRQYREPFRALNVAHCPGWYAKKANCAWCFPLRKTALLELFRGLRTGEML